MPIFEGDEQCADCGMVSREYRLVHAKGDDRLSRDNPEFRCEACSMVKSDKLKKGPKV